MSGTITAHRLPIGLVLAATAAACGGSRSAAPAGTPSPSPTTPVAADPLAELGWLEGRWETELADGTAEHWNRAGQSLIGVGLPTRAGRAARFELLIVARKDGRLTYTAMPGGRRQVDFPARSVAATSVEFANPAHDFPQALRYERRGETLSAHASAAGASTLDYTWHQTPIRRAAPLEEADRAFAADVAARGLDAWPEWFDPEGAQWSDHPVVGRQAIRDLMAPAFARPGFRLDWEPITSGLSPAGDAGYTIGRSTLSWTGQQGGPRAGIYVTIWRRQPDGTWRALFDTGWADPSLR